MVKGWSSTGRGNGGSGVLQAEGINAMLGVPKFYREGGIDSMYCREFRSSTYRGEGIDAMLGVLEL